jgi:hypothetical protein
MHFDTERLYQLLPAVYRIRDEAQGKPLRALLGVIAEQVAVLEENLEQLYDDQFIETCAQWVVPYIGDLLGYRALHGVTPEVSSPRAETANTIAYRRRKGTAAMLEQLARDVTGWHARVVEFFQLLATTQYMNHIRLGNLQSPNLRLWEPLERLNSPFERIAHTVDVRRIDTQRGQYNIPNVGIFLWSLCSYPLTNSPAFEVDERRFLFSPLGNNTHLFTSAQSETEITHLADPINAPLPISRRVLDKYRKIYYGSGKSLAIQVNDQEIAVDDIVVCDLSDTGPQAWAHMPPDDKYAIDPVHGRVALPGNLQFPATVEVTYQYGFSADMGGGEYQRGATLDEFDRQEPTIIRVPADQPTIQEALDVLPPDGGVVEIGDTGRYQETPTVQIDTPGAIELRAANRCRPTLVLDAAMQIAGAAKGAVTLNGLLICAGTGFTDDVLVQLGGSLTRLTIQHCTLVPGHALEVGGDPRHRDKPSLIVEAGNVDVTIDHSIIGGLRLAPGAPMQISDSIVDAIEETAVAVAAPDGSGAAGALKVENSTLIGKVHTTLLEASNTIFLAELSEGDTWTAPVRAQRKQAGCVRFSYLPMSASVPRRYYCQPHAAGPEARLRPQFASLRYGEPGYGRLSQGCAREIRAGADDESEMGAFHKLYQPQRETNLRVRLNEYLRIGLEAGIFYAT